MTTDNLGELAERIRHIARVPVLLVACDYDGTLAPLQSSPLEARPDRNAVAAMRQLAELADTHVTVISGRGLRDLAGLSRLPEEIRLIGSHGSEFELGFASELAPELVALRHQLLGEVHRIAERHGAFVEEKPTGATFHFRGLPPDQADAAREELVRGPAVLDGVFPRNGHEILDLSVIETNKGTALEEVRRQVSASAVLFMGDDLTDEDAFRTLTGPDVGVKVGEASTIAPFRVTDTSRVAQVLALLAELRGRWLRGEGLTPLEQHAVLSDLRTAAVVAPDSAITWMCLPRIDSAAVFAQLLGGPGAGHFTIRSGEGSEGPLQQRYRPHSKILETEFNNFLLTDFFDVSHERPSSLAGRSDLLRILEGTGAATIEFAPRLSFGRVPTQIQTRPEGLVVQGTSDLMVLRAPDVDWELIEDGVHQTAIGRVTLEPGSPVTLELRSGTSTLRADLHRDQDRFAESERYWTDWTSKLDLPAIGRDAVERSALTLKSMCHGPTGAVVSAMTTSLPRSLGGVRNWDQRYCWLREAAMAAQALARLGSPDEASDYLRWLTRLLETRTDTDRLAPLYNVTGRHLQPEAAISELPGYGGSRPVRVGNAAIGQVQYDMFGPIVDLVWTLHLTGRDVSDDHWRLVEEMVLAVSRRWRHPDHGFWQLRTGTRHHLHTKVSCWTAADRAIMLADRFLDRAPEAWIELRDQIADEVLERCWNPTIGSFTASYDSDEFDGTVLAVGLSGLLPADDDRFRSTVAAVERNLRVGSSVLRYRANDGLPGKAGAAPMMSFWLVEALCLVGEIDRAGSLFDQAAAQTGPTGLYTESFDPDSGRHLGNLPSGRGHVGLINSALRLDTTN